MQKFSHDENAKHTDKTTRSLSQSTPNIITIFFIIITKCTNYRDAITKTVTVGTFYTVRVIIIGSWIVQQSLVMQHCL